MVKKCTTYFTNEVKTLLENNKKLIPQNIKNEIETLMKLYEHPTNAMEHSINNSLHEYTGTKFAKNPILNEYTGIDLTDPQYEEDIMKMTTQIMYHQYKIANADEDTINKMSLKNIEKIIIKSQNDLYEPYKNNLQKIIDSIIDIMSSKSKDQYISLANVFISYYKYKINEKIDNCKTLITDNTDSKKEGNQKLNPVIFDLELTLQINIVYIQINMGLYFVGKLDQNKLNKNDVLNELKDPLEMKNFKEYGDARFRGWLSDISNVYKKIDKNKYTKDIEYVDLKYRKEQALELYNIELATANKKLELEKDINDMSDFVKNNIEKVLTDENNKYLL